MAYCQSLGCSNLRPCPAHPQDERQNTVDDEKNDAELQTPSEMEASKDDVCDYYEIRYETRPAAFGLAICDKTDKPYICLVPAALSAARKGVRVGSLLTHVNGVALEGKLASEWRPLLAAASAPIVIKFKYHPNADMLREVQMSECDNWRQWKKDIKSAVEYVKMVTISDSLCVRNAPGDESHAVGELKYGEVVYGTAHQGPFVRVMQQGRVLGWVLMTEGLRHNLKKLEEGEELPDANLPSFARQLSQRAQNMEGGVEGLYLTRAGTEPEEYWKDVHETVLGAIRLWTDGPTRHVEKGVASLIMDYVRVERVGADRWNFDLENCDSGKKISAEDLILNGRPTALIFVHERLLPMSLISLVLRHLGVEESAPFRLHPAVDLAIVLVRGGRLDHYHSEEVAERPDDAMYLSAALTTLQRDAWQVPLNVIYKANLAQLNFVYSKKQCSCPFHTSRLWVVNKNGMLSYTGDASEGNTVWVQALDILRHTTRELDDR